MIGKTQAEIPIQRLKLIWGV